MRRGFESLKDLMLSVKNNVPDREAAYKVDTGDGVRYVLAKTPAQAAMAMCKSVERCTNRQMVDAAFQALAERAPEEDEEPDVQV